MKVSGFYVSMTLAVGLLVAWAATAPARVTTDTVIGGCKICDYCTDKDCGETTGMTDCVGGSVPVWCEPKSQQGPVPINCVFDGGTLYCRSQSGSNYCKLEKCEYCPH